MSAWRGGGWRAISWRLLLGACLCLTGPGQAAAADLLNFLQQVQEAARTLDYAGIYVYQQGHSLQASRVVHVVDGTGERERLEVLDGAPRECLRQNGLEQCLRPDHKLVVIQPARSDHFPGLLLGNDQAIADHYSWQPSPHTYRIAGRDCAVSDLKARDHLRYSYRICTDLKTHLLLKSQTLDAAGHLVDQVAFSSIRLGADVQPAALTSPWNTRDWRLLTESSETIDLKAQGWRFSLPAGFAPVAELSRQIGPDHAVDQLVVSDGLTAISIFIETFDPKRDQNIRQGGLRQGAVNIYRLRLASYWLTAVGEVPAQTVRDLARAVQYVPRAAH
ncbi:MucB/RseB C-terminal domain-containing protein [Castellaniella caeni]|uniref:MucB/RseB C-terminal domain-containing protein n=1 Tax=Castellaniella caeni TaxID=266123 RepID=UPI000831E419|nr:MucB/RseB C-terminal domain-containing protein [Castellaniella caeni]